jgi:hypothetical protein
MMSVCIPASMVYLCPRKNEQSVIYARPVQPTALFVVNLPSRYRKNISIILAIYNCQSRQLPGCALLRDLRGRVETHAHLDVEDVTTERDVS